MNKLLLLIEVIVFIMFLFQFLDGEDCFFIETLFVIKNDEHPKDLLFQFPKPLPHPPNREEHN